MIILQTIKVDNKLLISNFCFIVQPQDGMERYEE